MIRPCPRDGEDLVVCAAPARADRLQRLEPPVRGAPMTVRVAPGAAVHAEAVGFVRAGIPDNRILAHLKLEF